MLPLGRSWPALNHQDERVLTAAARGVFKDSGCWDSYLLRSFDQAFRLYALFTLAPLSDHSVGERASLKLARELRGFLTNTTTRHTYHVLTGLRLVGLSLSLFGLSYFVGALLALWL